MTQTKGRLGDRLIDRGLLTQSQLEVALNEQRRAYRPLGEIIESLGFVSAEDMTQLMAADLGIPFVRADEIDPDPVLASFFDRSFAFETGSFPFRLDGGELSIAMIDPSDPERVSAVRSRFPYPLAIHMVTRGDLARLVRRHLVGAAGEVTRIFQDLDGQDAEFPVERVVDALLGDGVHRGATDIHVEPEEHVTRVRYRMDGVLTQGENLPRSYTDAVISRIKILSNLDIAERRRPQDGRLRIDDEGRPIDVRVSVRPCVDGENVVLRLLDRPGGVAQMTALGFSPERVATLRRVSERSHGLFLVTGPTGSGKTTTLYAMLAQVDAMARNVATVEDPVEYRMPLLRQSQVDMSIGFGFSDGLRSLLRQDPDVILVGEIRDRETADMAIKASMTGHLVFSTLHTNSAVGAVPRLTDLGIDPYLVEDSLIGVLAQRLVRTVCGSCAEDVAPTEEELEWLGGEVETLRSGKGCEFCNDTGLSGRSVISELFLPDEAMADQLRRGVAMGELRKLAREAGFEDMEEDGKGKVRAGLTTMEEVQRVNRSHRLSVDEREEL